jgi:hypothetical protein
LLAGSDTSATSTTATNTRQCFNSIGTAAQATLYLNGSYNQASSASTQCYKRGAVLYAVSDSGAGGTPFPDATRGAMMLFPFTAIEPTAIVRGDFPGLMHLGHAFTGVGGPPHLSTVSGLGAYSGRTFQMVGAGATWGLAIETSTGSW